MDLAHEAEDLVLYQSLLGRPESSPCVYASCDYHIGPELWFDGDGLEEWTRTIQSVAVHLAKRSVEIGLGITIHAHMAPEQLSHATYVWVGDQPLTEDAVLEGFRHGRTFSTRGKADVTTMRPVPGLDQTTKGYPVFRLTMPMSYESPRPRTVFVLRDGLVCHQQVFGPKLPLDFEWADWKIPPGRHEYVVYVPSKFVSSPIVVEGLNGGS